MKNVSSLFLMALVLLFSACSKEEVISQADSQPDVTVEDGMLIFKNQKVYDATIEHLSGLSPEQLDAWESQFSGFQSQRSIYERAVDEDWAHYQKMEALVNSGKRTVEDITAAGEEYAPYVRKHSDILAFSEDGTFSLKVENYEFNVQHVLNEKGLVQVGSSIKQYEEGFIKVVLDGQKHKVAYLNSYQESNSAARVQVYQVQTNQLDPKKSGFNAFSGDDNCTGYTSGGGQRVKGVSVLGMKITTDVFGTHGYPGQIISSPYAYLKATNEYKGLFGWKTKRTNYLRIIGSNIGYDIGSFGGGNINFDQGTGGDLQTSITRYVFRTNNYYPGTYWVPFLFSGSARFVGRHNSTCSI